VGGRIIATYSDNDISAYSGKTRPDFEKLLKAMINREFQVLIVWHIDRLYRSMQDLARIIEAAEDGGVQIRTVSSGDIDLSNSAGKMIARILGSVARQESEHHAERRREANRQRALAGEWRREGSRPFGYTKDGVPLEPEASMLRKAARDILGSKSLHAVAREWNESGTTTVRGVKWSNLHVRRVLTNPRIAARS
jgi:site-specific DNA recombinase